jgi:hypothetical protein
MSDHEFEKQVHQKLEELKLRPSDTVWMEVERNIRQHKRRRRFLWLWSAALLVSLTTSGIILYNYINRTENTVEMAKATPATLSNTSTTTLSPNSTNSPNSSNTNTQASPIQPEPGNAASVPANETNNTLQPSAPSIPSKESKQPGEIPPAAPETRLATTGSNERKPANAITSHTQKETIGNKENVEGKKGKTTREYNRNAQTGSAYLGYSHERNANKTKRVSPVSKRKETAPETIAIIGAEPTEQPDALTATMPALVHEAEPITTNKAATDPFNNKTFMLLTPDSANVNAVAAMPIQRKTPSLWHWGVKADAGYSRISVSKLFQLRGLLSTEKSYAEDLAARSYSSPNNISTGNSLINVTAAAAPVKNASPIQADFAASAGVFVQRTLTSRLKISIGLEYSYMTANTQIGKKYDSSITVNIGTSSVKIVPKYYDSPGYIDEVSGGATNFQSQGSGRVYYSQKQRYRFHYIEIPVMLNWQINKGRRLPPLVFDGGVSIGRLFSVDALHYEGIKGVYYEDNGLFNKTQFNFVTGLSVGLLQRSRHPIWVGPDLRYSLNGLVKKDVSSGQYLWSTGISIKMLLGRL